jgi:hypothetical protein
MESDEDVMVSYGADGELAVPLGINVNLKEAHDEKEGHKRK